MRALQEVRGNLQHARQIAIIPFDLIVVIKRSELPSDGKAPSLVVYLLHNPQLSPRRKFGATPYIYGPVSMCPVSYSGHLCERAIGAAHLPAKATARQDLTRRVCRPTHLQAVLQNRREPVSFDILRKLMSSSEEYLRTTGVVQTWTYVFHERLQIKLGEETNRGKFTRGEAKDQSYRRWPMWSMLG
jgi:hypothetical protein